VGGDVRINSTDVPSLAGLHSLAVVRGGLHLTSNRRLTSLHGLHNVRFVGGPLNLPTSLSRTFGACGSLQSLQSLPASAPSAHRCHALNRTLCEATVASPSSSSPHITYRCAPTVMTLVMQDAQLSILAEALMRTGVEVRQLVTVRLPLQSADLPPCHPLTLS
jgi:hypothetical protein